MLTLFYAGTAFILAWLQAPAVMRMLSRGRLLQPNYLHEPIPTGAGLLIPLAVLPTLLLSTWLQTVGLTPLTVQRTEWATLISVLGFSFLGLLDDASGTKTARGLRGHLRALLQGELTTGMIKAIYGSVLACITAAVAPGRAPLLLSALVISLSANTINLFDLRPGRALKAFFVGYALIALCSGNSGGPALCIAGAAAAFLPWDLRAQAMLGDTGANVLGATLGLFVVTEFSTSILTVVSAGLLGLHIYAEKRSLTTLIASVPLLQRLDDLGRRK